MLITERNAVAETMTASAVEEAQELALKCIQSKYADCGLSVKPKQTPEVQQPVVAAILDGAALGNAFKAQSVLRRKQLQYALKKLGVYSSSVDGLWGNGTKTAFSNYIKINDLKVSSGEDVFASVLSKVDVPTAFAAPKPKKTTAIKKQSNYSGVGSSYVGLNPSKLVSRLGLPDAEGVVLGMKYLSWTYSGTKNSYRPTYDYKTGSSGISKSSSQESCTLRAFLDDMGNVASFDQNGPRKACRKLTRKL